MSEVREGLICPMCMQDLGTIGNVYPLLEYSIVSLSCSDFEQSTFRFFFLSAELSAHFETAHPGPESDVNEAIASFKEIFAKKKKKLLNEDRAPSSERSRQPESSQIQLQHLVYVNPSHHKLIS